MAMQKVVGEYKSEEQKNISSEKLVQYLYKTLPKKKALAEYFP